MFIERGLFSYRCCHDICLWGMQALRCLCGIGAALAFFLPQRAHPKFYQSSGREAGVTIVVDGGCPLFIITFK